MIKRTWQWFKHGHQFDVRAKAISANGKPTAPEITIFIETKDKQDARRVAIVELSKRGYRDVEICKVIAR